MFTRRQIMLGSFGALLPGSLAAQMPALGSQGSGQVRAQILHRMGLPVAPEAIQFGCSVTGASISEPSVRNTYSETFHDLIYIWDFGDPGAASDKVVNLPAAWNDLNKGYGKFPIHVYSRPDRYTATVWVYELDGTFVGMDQVEQIAINDPARVFPNRLTIALDPSGRFDGAADGAQYVRTWQEMLNAKTAAGQPTRVQIAAGAEITLSESVDLQWYLYNWYISAFGEGPKPRIIGTSSADNTLFNGGFRSFEGASVVLDGLRIERDWDSVQETGTAINGVVSQHRNHVLVTDCAFEHIDSGVNMFSDTGDGVMFVVHNTSMTDWRNFGIGPGLRSWGSCVGVLGCAIYDAPEASEWLRGPDSKAHGPIRIPGGLYITISGNDFFSRKGWDAHQPCMRPLATSNPAEWPYAQIERNACEGGWAVIECSHAGTPDLASVNMIIESNLVVTTSGSNHAISVSYPGITLRNNLIVWPDQRNLLLEGGDNPSKGEFSCICWRGPFDNSTQVPLKIYNNTGIIHVSDRHRGDKHLGFYPSQFEPLRGREVTPEAYPAYQGGNNVFQSPGNPSFQSEDAQLTRLEINVASGGVWQPRWQGRRYLTRAVGQNPDMQPTLDRSYATPQGQVLGFAPGPNSPLINDADGLTLAFDALGEPMRGTNRDRGWRER